MGILCLRRFYRHCKVVITRVSGVVILQVGSRFYFCMGNVSLSIAALCHANNLPELETFFRDIITLEWEQQYRVRAIEILPDLTHCFFVCDVDETLVCINGTNCSARHAFFAFIA